MRRSPLLYDDTDLHLKAALSGAASVGSVAGVGAFGGPALALSLAASIPWIPLVAERMAWLRRYYGWLALLFAVLLAQVVLITDHIARVVQIHGQGRSWDEAAGAFGISGNEWLVFSWSAATFAVLVLIVITTGGGRWLLAAGAVSAWIVVDHVSIVGRFASTGVAGDAGLLAEGGRIAGGLPVSRAVLHLVFHAALGVLLLMAFAQAGRVAVSRPLQRAFPRAPRESLLEAGPRVRSRRFARGEPIASTEYLGREPSAFVLVRGAVQLDRPGDQGDMAPSARLLPGHVFNRYGIPGYQARALLIRALDPVEVLEIDPGTLEILGASLDPRLPRLPDRAGDLREALTERLSSLRQRPPRDA